MVMTSQAVSHPPSSAKALRSIRDHGPGLQPLEATTSSVACPSRRAPNAGSEADDQRPRSPGNTITTSSCRRCTVMGLSG